MTPPLIELRNVTKRFGRGAEQVTAVDNISLRIEHGETVCLVGESGCGKSTTGRMMAGLLPVSSGQILFRGENINSLDTERYRAFRRAVQIIHQDPYASLNPTQTVRQMLVTPLLRHGKARDRSGAERRALELLEVVDLTPARDFLDKYPHQLSGGQRQRVSVARALTVEPTFIVADEAVSMVDVSIRVSLLNMLSRLKQEFDVTFLFITHDLALAKYFAWQGRIVVMYLGRIVEEGPTPRIITDPRHPYTQALLAAVPEADPELTHRKRQIQLRSAEIPSLLALPPGCTFHPRCPYAVPGECDVHVPELEPIPEGGSVACPIRKGEPIQLIEV
ncbi:ABC transporter ATP-binding protein [Litorilinea aerophila]|uniref:ABC transporter ATP-binding protein n=1 Tax=Litorilinea aerophila TaxID=1204385 RepID=A0A540VA88_9CHLR|nr:ABC transporter ATP-binding protein [Litorilinea aerophila]MCC9078480.1 ABC transporter ATP-binding protein [Litorilinea aerophila]OUC07039.1 peptide ABC transporter ATP-binding protein [Litorilinea aerophila]GIV80067.1 MAG: oligopeptide ABC transporter ATP-binding protein [Litorilinea sp.]